MSQLLLWLGLLTTGLAATGDEHQKPIDGAPVERPSLALLEFLGSFESIDGEWVDPLSLPVELDDEQVEEKKLDDDRATDEPHRQDAASHQINNRTSNDEKDDDTTQTAALR